MQQAHYFTVLLQYQLQHAIKIDVEINQITQISLAIWSKFDCFHHYRHHIIACLMSIALIIAKFNL